MPAKAKSERSKLKPRPPAKLKVVDALASTPEAPRKRGKTAATSPKFDLPAWWSQALVALVIVFFGLIRIRLLSFPLERDEGEYAYAGQLILHAINPYRLCYSMKLPGTAAAYALLMTIFGQTPSGIHMGLLLVNAATTVLVYLLARRLFGKLAGVSAAAAFGMLSIEPAMLTFAGHATHFVILPAVAGILILLKAIETERLPGFFWSGLMLGLAFIMKQPGIFFIFFGVFYLACAEWMRGLRWRLLLSRMALLLLGAVLPFALTCLIMLRAGIFSRFWFWTFSYASQYGSIVSLSRGLDVFGAEASRAVSPAVLIWVIAAAGTVAVLWGQKARIQTIFLLSFLAFSFAAVCPGFYFRPHYFILLLPAIAVSCGVALSRVTGLIQESSQNPMLALIPAAVFAVLLGAAIFRDAGFFFQGDVNDLCHKIYGHNPFPEAPKIADFIRSRSAEGDRVAVVGSEPEIYFYSQRLSATGYVYTYPLMEPQPFAAKMQREMESEIENAAPRFVVFVDVPLSWLSGPDSDKGILTWSEKYVQNGYDLVGIADLRDDGTEFRWDSDARSYKPRSQSRVYLFQRR